MNSLMLAGTGSGVGKSLLTAGFCRFFARQGIKVAPFKAQNMSLNGGILDTGEEISRAQIQQAEAAGIIPDPRMNPIMLKPVGDARSVMVRMGVETATLSATEYYKLKEENFKIAADAYKDLSHEYDLVVLEGAGSPAEINLQQDDIVNMRMAAYAGARVILIGDISRGGVFASLKGTADLIEDQYKPLLKGFIVNKFRGDISILEPGNHMLEEMTGLPVLGVLPWFEHHLEEEDSLDKTDKVSGGDSAFSDSIRTGILWLPRMTGYALTPALKCYANIDCRFLHSAWDLSGSEIVIVPDILSVDRGIEYIKSHPGAAEIIKILQNSRLPVISVGKGAELAAVLGLEGITVQRAEDFNKPNRTETIFKSFFPGFMVKDDPRIKFMEEWDRLADRLVSCIGEEKIMRLVNSAGNF